MDDGLASAKRLVASWLVIKQIVGAGGVMLPNHAPLIIAEIEVDSVDETFERPAWLGEEVTHDRRYYNHALAFSPYARWES